MYGLCLILIEGRPILLQYHKWLEEKYTLVFQDYLFHGKELWVLRE